MDERRTVLSEEDQLRHEELSKDPDYMQNARRPEGEAGRIMIRRMNGGAHAQLAAWGFPLLKDIPSGANILDTGCGGGANLARWMDFCPECRVTGLDYSPISVDESRRFNSEEIAAGRCSVVEGDVTRMPFGDNAFDCVSAFETIYFWPDIERAFAEVFRVLKPGGTFFICNESDGTDERTRNAAPLIKGLTLYGSDALQRLLARAGCAEISFYRLPGTFYLAVIAKKLLSSQD